MPTLRGQLTNRKGQVTRKAKTLQKALDTNIGDKVAHYRLLQDLEDRGNEVADLLDDLIDNATSDEVLALQKEKTDIIAAQDAELGMFELLIVARSTPVGDPSAPSSPKEIFKLQAELKPFALSNTNTPPEMRNWIVRFRSYASTSNIKLVGLADQPVWRRIWRSIWREYSPPRPARWRRACLQSRRTFCH
jgi:hypothetical protein